MLLFQDMTDQELVTAARRCAQPTYHALADRIEQRSADTARLVNALTQLMVNAKGGDPFAMACKSIAQNLLEELEESSTIAKLRREKR